MRELPKFLINFKVEYHGHSHSHYTPDYPEPTFPLHSAVEAAMKELLAVHPDVLDSLELIKIGFSHTDRSTITLTLKGVVRDTIGASQEPSGGMSLPNEENERLESIKKGVEGFLAGHRNVLGWRLEEIDKKKGLIDKIMAHLPDKPHFA